MWVQKPFFLRFLGRCVWRVWQYLWASGPQRWQRSNWKVWWLFLVCHRLLSAMHPWLWSIALYWFRFLPWNTKGNVPYLSGLFTGKPVWPWQSNTLDYMSKDVEEGEERPRTLDHEFDQYYPRSKQRDRLQKMLIIRPDHVSFFSRCRPHEAKLERY